MAYDNTIRLINFLILFFCIQVAYCRPPSTPLCLEINRIAWRKYQPFLRDRPDQNKSGLVSDLLKVSLRSCCRGNLNLELVAEFHEQNAAAYLAMNESIDFILPVQASVGNKKYLGNIFLSIVDSPGFAMYVIPSPSTGEVIVQAISSTWPFILLMFVMVGTSGTLFCLIETILQRNKFKDEIWKGYWWAFVSMTTVGYGDICPKTKGGKVFSIVWVLTGVASCALFTSYITTILTSACLTSEVVLNGMKVGVLSGTEEHKYALKKNSIPTGYRSIDDVIEALDKKQVQGIMLDSFVAAEYQEDLQRFRLQAIIEHVTSNGVVFQNGGTKFASCIRDYLLSRQGDVFDMISKTVQPIQISTLSTAEEKSKNLIDPTTTGFQTTVTGMAVLMCIIVMIGTIWDKRKQRKWKQNQKIDAKEWVDDYMTLTEWRNEYKRSFYDAMKSIERDAESIRNKCINISNKLTLQRSGLVTLKMSMQQHNK